MYRKCPALKAYLSRLFKTAQLVVSVATCWQCYVTFDVYFGSPSHKDYPLADYMWSKLRLNVFILVIIKQRLIVLMLKKTSLCPCKVHTWVLFLRTQWTWMDFVLNWYLGDHLPILIWGADTLATFKSRLFFLIKPLGLLQTAPNYVTIHLDCSGLWCTELLSAPVWSTCSTINAYNFPSNLVSFHWTWLDLPLWSCLTSSSNLTIIFILYYIILYFLIVLLL